MWLNSLQRHCHLAGLLVPSENLRQHVGSAVVLTDRKQCGDKALRKDCL